MIRPINIDFRQEGDELIISLLTGTSERTDIALNKVQLGFLIARLMQEIHDDRVTTLDLNRHGPDQEVAIHSFSVQKPQIGAHRRLMIFARLSAPDRSVRIPLELSPEQVEKLIEDLE